MRNAVRDGGSRIRVAFDLGTRDSGCSSGYLKCQRPDIHCDLDSLRSNIAPLSTHIMNTYPKLRSLLPEPSTRRATREVEINTFKKRAAHTLSEDENCSKYLNTNFIKR